VLVLDASADFVVSDRSRVGALLDAPACDASPPGFLSRVEASRLKLVGERW